MGNLRIGRLCIKRVHLILSAVGLVILIGGVIAIVNSTVWYEYVYTFNDSNLEIDKGISEQIRDIRFNSGLTKGEVIRGKLVVESGNAILLIDEVRGTGAARRVVDSGRIETGKSFRFSLKSEYTVSLYSAHFSFQRSTSWLNLPKGINAKFYCNIDPGIVASRGYFTLFGLPETIKFTPVKLR